MNDKNKKQKIEKNTTPVIDRKEALKKAGYIALSAATMMLLVNKPDKAVASSPAPPPGW